MKIFDYMSVDSPIISVIIPVYNSEKYLSRCIDSVLGQTFNDFEILLIDDGSKDNSGKICDEYALNDKRIKVFHNSNKGVSCARNFGLDHAKGEYISFIDSDDWIGPDFFKDFLGKEGDCYDICFQNYVLHNPDGSCQVKELHPYNRKERPVDDVILYLLKEVKFGWAWIKLFRASIISKYNLRFDENVSLREDELFALRYCKYINSICVRDVANYHYYIYGDSLTRSFKDPCEYIRISKLLMTESSYIKTEGVKEYLESYYLVNLYNAVLMLYVRGCIEGYTKQKRYAVIDTFLTYYFLHTHIQLPYKSFRSKCLYWFLWRSRSSKLIDHIMQKWFSVSYNK